MVRKRSIPSSSQWSSSTVTVGTDAPTITKYVHRCRKRIQSQCLFDQDRQAIDPGSEINRFAVQVHLQRVVEPEHGNLLSSCRTGDRSFTVASQRLNSTPLGSRTCMLIARPGFCSLIWTGRNAGACLTSAGG